METMAEMLQNVFSVAPTVVERLNRTKAENPKVQWYPFRTLDKVQLISRVVRHFDTVDVRWQNERPRILDVGTADGDLSFLFEAAGCDVVAIDNAQSNFNRCEGVRSMRELIGSSVRLVEKDIDYDFTVDGQFDFVVMLDILYHLRNPLGTLISLCNLGKYMVISTRIFEEIEGRGVVSDLPYGYLLAPFEAAHNDPTNYWMFTQCGFRRLLERGGWRVLEWEYFGYARNDSSPFDPSKDKRVIALCERLEGFERLKYGHFISREHALESSQWERTTQLNQASGGPAPTTDTVEAQKEQWGGGTEREQGLEAELHGVWIRLRDYEGLLSAREEEIQTIYASKSWRLTAPIRDVEQIIRDRRHALRDWVASVAGLLRRGR